MCVPHLCDSTHRAIQSLGKAWGWEVYYFHLPGSTEDLSHEGSQLWKAREFSGSHPSSGSSLRTLGVGWSA